MDFIRNTILSGPLAMVIMLDSISSSCVLKDMLGSRFKMRYDKT